ncbi:MAG TPA: LmeA family phospholipid-binding protein [Acidimicrobiales bacterium]|nr:LmeA family phospholipid-binding protein [Acidimicrobiales bacterium]
MRRMTPVPGPELLLAGPAQVLQLVATSIRTSLRGRRRTFVLGGHEVTAELDDLTVTSGLGLAVGQFDGVHVELKDLDWKGRRVSTLRLSGHNVHLRPGLTPTLVASPVTFDAVIAVADLATWVPDIVGRRIEVDIDADGVARVQLRDRPRLGSVEIDVRVEGRFLVLDPTTLVAGTRRFGGLRRLPPFRLPLMAPHGVHVTEVGVEPGGLRVGGHVTEWSEPLAVTEVQRFVRLLSPELDPVILPRGR